MYEVIAAIVGVILGGVLAWWMGRYKPNYIICEEEFRAELSIGGPLKSWNSWWNTSNIGAKFSLLIGLPRTQISFQGEVVENLSLITLNLRNTSGKAINKPLLKISLNPDTKILGLDTEFKPERAVGHSSSSGSKSEAVSVIIEGKDVYLELDSLFPYELNKETLVVDIICSGKVDTPNVFGQGTYEDGTAWAVKYENWEEVGKKSRKLFAMIGIALVTIFGAYSLWFYNFFSSNYFSIRSSERFAIFWGSPEAIIFITLLLLVFFYTLYLMLFKNFRLIIPIPFTKLRIETEIRKRPPKKK